MWIHNFGVICNSRVQLSSFVCAALQHRSGARVREIAQRPLLYYFRSSQETIEWLRMKNAFSSAIPNWMLSLSCRRCYRRRADELLFEIPTADAELLLTFFILRSSMVDASTHIAQTKDDKFRSHCDCILRLRLLPFAHLLCECPLSDDENDFDLDFAFASFLSRSIPTICVLKLKIYRFTLHFMKCELYFNGLISMRIECRSPREQENRKLRAYSLLMSIVDEFSISNFMYLLSSPRMRASIVIAFFL